MTPPETLISSSYFSCPSLVNRLSAPNFKVFLTAVPECGVAKFPNPVIHLTFAYLSSLVIFLILYLLVTLYSFPWRPYIKRLGKNGRRDTGPFHPATDRRPEPGAGRTKPSGCRITVTRGATNPFRIASSPFATANDQ